MKKVLLKTDQNNPAIKAYKKAVEGGIVVVEFLKESNAIEDVWDGKSLLQAIRAWKYIENKDKLTLSNILHTHGVLMKGKLDPEETGAFRKRPVWIGGHEAKPWFVIPELMEQWLELANEIKEVVSPDTAEDFIKQDHIQFEAIHPFIDGNGRMGRILLNWQRVKAGLPILVIKESTKFEEYYPWFNA